jgi:hypothetical protein
MRKLVIIPRLDESRSISRAFMELVECTALESGGTYQS